MTVGKTVAAALVLAAMAGSACARKPFNVRPRPVAPPGEFRARAAAGSVEIQAGAIRDEDYLYGAFDANLIMAGVLPLQVLVKNSGGGAVDLKPVRFWLESGGHRQKPMGPGGAFKRLIGYYKIRAYNPDGYKVSLADFVSYGFDSRLPIRPGESRWGLLFFDSAGGQQPGSGLVLSVKGVGTAELKLNVE